MKFEKIKPIFTLAGLICTIMLAISYVIGGVILINGLEQALGTQQLIMYAVYNAIMTTMILISMGSQGQLWAKDLDENKAIIKRLNDLKPKKEKKIHSMKWYWGWEIPKKIVLKAGWAVFSTLAVTTIFINGNGDMSLLWLIGVNIVLSAGTGLLFCSKTFDYYNNNEVPLMKQKIADMEAKNNDL